MRLFDTDLPQQARRGDRVLALDVVVDAHHDLEDVDAVVALYQEGQTDLTFFASTQHGKTDDGVIM